jgi:cobalt-precorrin-5B (C1)-methyltransferase
LAKTGYTLPVFAVAAAKAALEMARSIATGSNLPGSDTPGSDTPGSDTPGFDTPGSNLNPPHEITLSLDPTVSSLPAQTATIAIEQIAPLGDGTVLAMTRSDPGDNLDLTRGTPIWARVELVGDRGVPVILEGGEGIGKNRRGQPSLSGYARSLFAAELDPLVPPGSTALVRIILPAGRQLAERTSNAAFGVFEGLALVGTSGIAEAHTSTDHLEASRQQVRSRVATHPDLVFCIGSNGQQVAARLGVDPDSLISVGNWLGPLLVEAGLVGARSVTLLGYHGKLIKLAGGIFNTSSHIADAKTEILAAIALRLLTSSSIFVDPNLDPKLDVATDPTLDPAPTPITLNPGHTPLTVVRSLLDAPTAAAAQQVAIATGIAPALFAAAAQEISRRSHRYVAKYAERSPAIGTILFDRQGHIVGQDPIDPPSTLP